MKTTASRWQSSVKTGWAWPDRDGGAGRGCGEGPLVMMNHLSLRLSHNYSSCPCPRPCLVFFARESPCRDRMRRNALFLAQGERGPEGGEGGTGGGPCFSPSPACLGVHLLVLRFLPLAITLHCCHPPHASSRTAIRPVSSPLLHQAQQQLPQSARLCSSRCRCVWCVCLRLQRPSLGPGKAP